MTKSLLLIAILASCTANLTASPSLIDFKELDITIQKGVPGVIYQPGEDDGRHFTRSGIVIKKGKSIAPIETQPEIDSLLKQSVDKLFPDPMQAIVLENALLRTGRYSELRQLVNVPEEMVVNRGIFSDEVLTKKSAFAQKIRGFIPLFIIENSAKTGYWVIYDVHTSEFNRASMDFFLKAGPALVPSVGDLTTDRDLMDLFNALIYDEMKKSQTVSVIER